MTKSRKKMLISSIAMLLVALVALGSATYAWFTINKIVKADTMKVQAAVADGLVISNKQNRTADGDWGPVASFSTNAKSLFAASMNVEEVDADTLSSSTAMYYANDVKQAGKYVADGYGGAPTASHFASTTLVNNASYDANADGLAFASNNYSAAYTFWVASSGSAITGSVSAKIEASGDGITFMKAALCDSTGKVIGFYNNGDYKAVTGVDNNGVPTIAADDAASAVTDSITAIASEVPVKADAKKFTLYVWCEGNDEQCVDASASAANFTVTFTLD